MPRDDSRREMLCTSLEDLHRDLSEALGQFFDAAPDEVHEERSQYTVEIPDALLERELPTSLDGLIAWSLALNGTLRERFRHLSRSAVAGSLRDTYASVAELVAGYEKRIARLAEGVHDL